jgi:hypothetical protein
MGNSLNIYFMNLVKDAFFFPFRGNGKVMLIFGGILGVISDLASLAPMLGIFASVLILGYFIAIYFQIIQSTATGANEAPDYPEISNIVEDLAYPVLQVIFVGFISFIPLIVMAAYTIGTLTLGVVLGVAYFPMAMMAVVVLGELRAANPLFVVRSIVSAGGLYWVAVTSLLILYFVETLVVEILGGSFIIGSLIAAFLGMYTLMANGRILGLIYREKEEELGWL